MVPRAELEAVCAAVLTADEFAGAIAALVRRGVVTVEGPWVMWSADLKEVA